jgi:hypothetical protein
MLEKQLVLKGIMTPEDWANLVHKINFNFSKDNYFTELKDNEIAEARVNLARNFQDMAGKYYSHEWIRKNILQQSADDIAEQDVVIDNENAAQEPRWINPAIEQNVQLIAQHNAEMQQQGMEQQPQQTPEEQNKYEQVRQAMMTVQQQKEKGSPANRSIQDQAKYKAAVQLVAKNPDIVKQMSTRPQGQ